MVIICCLMISWPKNFLNHPVLFIRVRTINSGYHAWWIAALASV